MIYGEMCLILVSISQKNKSNNSNLHLPLRCSHIQSSTNRRAPGFVNFVLALAYHFCLNLPAAFTQPGARLLVKPCSVEQGSLTYSAANGLPNGHTLPVTSVCLDLRLAPAIVVAPVRGFAPLEVLNAVGPAVLAASLQSWGRNLDCVVVSRFYVVLSPASCFEKVCIYTT